MDAKSSKVDESNIYQEETINTMGEGKDQAEIEDKINEVKDEVIDEAKDEAIGEVNETNEASEQSEEFKIIKHKKEGKDGQTKCPRCGATEIATNLKTGKLRCYFCRHEFDPETVEDIDISTLEGINVFEGAQNIADDSEDIITLKCQSCGAEVVIDTESSTQARCHWCRNTLSINSVIPNGAVPDVILPFKLSKEEAEAKIAEFVNARKFFAHPTFKKEFTTANICGVYFPYMLVDVNAHMYLKGRGEIETARYMVVVDEEKDKKEERYDADVYHVERDFDIMIDDLTIEANIDKLEYASEEKTTNIINSIMPFDTKACVRYDSNYLKGYTSEKRDTNVKVLKKITEIQAADVARIFTNKHLIYDRGVKWRKEEFEIKGQSWKASYLPVWLYSYMQEKGDKKLLHYVAVNGRTAETMGSVPINKTRLISISLIVELIGIIIAICISMAPSSSSDDSSNGYEWALLLSGFAYYYYMYRRYRNDDARHTYEKETKYIYKNMVKVDEFITHRYNLSNETMEGANNEVINGSEIDIAKILAEVEAEEKAKAQEKAEIEAEAQEKTEDEAKVEEKAEKEES